MRIITIPLWPFTLWNSDDVVKNPVELVSVRVRECLELDMHKNHSTSAENAAEVAVALAPPGKKYLGILLALLASISCPLTVFMAKVLAPRYDPFNLALWKFQGYLLPPSIFMIYQLIVHKKTDMFEDIWPFSSLARRNSLAICVRTLTGIGAVVGQFYSLRYISLADSSVIRFSTPIFVVVVAYFILREPFSIVQLLMGISSLVGIIILARPPFLTGEHQFDTKNLIGLGFAMGSMMSTTCYFISLRYLRGVNSLLIIFGSGVLSNLLFVVVLLLTAGFQLPRDMWDLLLVLALIVLTFTNQILITTAFKFEQSGVVSLVRCLDVVFSFFYQFIFTSVIPDLSSVLSAFLVVLSVCVIGLQKWVSQLPSDDRRRNRFNFLLK